MKNANTVIEDKYIYDINQIRIFKHDLKINNKYQKLPSIFLLNKVCQFLLVKSAHSDDTVTHSWSFRNIILVGIPLLFNVS